MATTRWTADDMPDQQGCTALVTGANSGLGLRTAQGLAAHGAHVLLACRNPEKAAAALEQVRAVVSAGAAVEVVPLDLADLASVEACADRLTGALDHLDVLVNNAGVMALPYRTTADGFEMQLGTNHLGHFALTGRLLPLLEAAPAPRVVTVASFMHRAGRIRFDDLMSQRRYGRWRAYGQSKLANLLFMRELARRAAAAGSKVVSVAAHPGWAATHLQAAGPEMAGDKVFVRLSHVGNKLLAQDDVAGARPQLYAATEAGVLAGDYWGPNRLGMWGYPHHSSSNRRSKDVDVARRLWERSEDLTKVTYSFTP